MYLLKRVLYSPVHTPNTNVNNITNESTLTVNVKRRLWTATADCRLQTEVKMQTADCTSCYHFHYRELMVNGLSVILANRSADTFTPNTQASLFTVSCR